MRRKQNPAQANQELVDVIWLPLDTASFPDAVKRMLPQASADWCAPPGAAGGGACPRCGCCWAQVSCARAGSTPAGARGCFDRVPAWASQPLRL